MSELQIFSNPEFGQVRTLTENNKTLFCASDVAKALGYVNAPDAVAKHCRGTIVKRDTPTNCVTPQGTHHILYKSMSYITEGDVYRLITHSKLPAAEKFESWMFDEVLPSIRKHGTTNNNLLETYAKKNEIVSYNNENVQMFSNPNFGNIRVIMRDEEPWFVGIDVCSALDLTNPTIATSRLDEDERSKFNLGRQGNTIIVNEAGLYSLVLGSRKPEAKAFKRWITHDVIPTIRKHGAYLTDNLVEYFMQDPRKIGGFFIMYADEQDKRKKAELESAHKTQVITGLTEDVSLAEKRQRINQIVKFRISGTQYKERWALLYSEFEKKYHINLKLRYENNKKNFKPQLKSVMDYVERGLHMIDELYELTCKLFESDFDKLLEYWSSTIKMDNNVTGDFYAE